MAPPTRPNDGQVPLPASSSFFTSSPSVPSPAQITSPDATRAETAAPFCNTVLLMLLLTKRWLGAYLSFGSVGWLWHSTIGTRKSPNEWNLSEYADAENGLSGWSAAVCKSVGVCGNAFGDMRNSEGILSADEGAREGAEFVPEFVMEYAPYVYLHSQERFLPGDIGEHLLHTTPRLNYTPITHHPNHPHLTNLNLLNKFGQHVYLTSDDDPERAPSWLRGDRNRPIQEDEGEPDELGLSSAPGIIIWIEKEKDIIDAFYFYFYSFNLGNTVAGWRFGNHVGDWEHTAIRFVGGEPKEMFFSEHSGGSAYEFQAVEKIGQRPVSYSARGSHANYARPGVHYYAIPFHLLSDVTNKGPLWDVTKNAYIYRYNITSDELIASLDTPLAPVEWFHFMGRWGDRYYPLSDRRQYRVAGQYHYVNGPTGPKDKNLGRQQICQNEGICVVQPSLEISLEGVKGDKWDEEDTWGNFREETMVIVENGEDVGNGEDGEDGEDGVEFDVEMMEEV